MPIYAEAGLLSGCLNGLFGKAYIVNNGCAGEDTVGVVMGNSIIYTRAQAHIVCVDYHASVHFSPSLWVTAGQVKGILGKEQRDFLSGWQFGCLRLQFCQLRLRGGKHGDSH